MWNYEKRLQYPVNISRPNAEMAKVIISQFGGPDGEVGAAMRYLSQRYSNTNRQVAGVLTDIGISVTKLPTLAMSQAPCLHGHLANAVASEAKPKTAPSARKKLTAKNARVIIDIAEKDMISRRISIDENIIISIQKENCVVLCGNRDRTGTDYHTDALGA